MPGSLKSLDTQHLQCRSWAHAWEYTISYLVRYDRTECIELHINCTRCECERIDTYVRRTGELMKRLYRWPDGYLIKDLKSWGGRSMFNANARVELLGRYVTKSRRKEPSGTRKLPVHGKRVRKGRR